MIRRNSTRGARCERGRNLDIDHWSAWAYQSVGECELPGRESSVRELLHWCPRPYQGSTYSEWWIELNAMELNGMGLNVIELNPKSRTDHTRTSSQVSILTGFDGQHVEGGVEVSDQGINTTHLPMASVLGLLCMWATMMPVWRPDTETWGGRLAMNGHSGGRSTRSGEKLEEEWDHKNWGCAELLAIEAWASEWAKRMKSNLPNSWNKWCFPID